MPIDTSEQKLALVLAALVRAAAESEAVHVAPDPQAIYDVRTSLLFLESLTLVFKEGGGDGAAWFSISVGGRMLLDDQSEPIVLPDHPAYVWWRCCQAFGLRPGTPEPPNPYIFASSEAQKALVPARAEELTYGF